MLKAGFIVLFILLTSPSLASDFAKEKRWAEQIEQGLMDGDMIYLQAGDHEFLALETVAAEAGDTAVIVLHGIGAHPDWPDIIYPLRTTLPETGWTTLSLQLPILANEAEGKDYQPLMKDVPMRINAGIDHLSKAGYKKIYIVAHSMGAEMGSYYLAQANLPGVIKGYVGIGMNVNNPDYLAKISLPVLDLYGSEDLEGVLKSAKARADASASNKQYSQVKVDGANHFFNGKDGELMEIVTEWIKKY